MDIKKVIEKYVCNEWKTILLDEKNIKKYYQYSFESINKQLSSEEYLPKENELFRALNFNKISDIKLIILGQDPFPWYPDGLAFSSSISQKSTYNIFKEIWRTHSIDIKERKNYGCNLDDWAQQGVLLLNTVLSIKPGKIKSHVGIGWENITMFIVRYILENNKNTYILVMGNDARKMLNKYGISYESRFICVPHPSPNNTTKPFYGCGCFKLIDEKLGDKKINW